MCNPVINSNSFRAVIFDLYGTLLEAVKDEHLFLKLARRSPIPVRQALQTAMTTDNPTLESYAQRVNVVELDNIKELERSLTGSVNLVKPYDDAFETLELLKSLGIKIGLISNLATPYKKPFFDCGLDKYIDTAIFSCDFGVMKPDPGIYLHIAEALDVNVNEMLMIGDHYRSDVVGATNVGMKAIQIVRGDELPKPGVNTTSTLLGAVQSVSRLAT